MYDLETQKLLQWCHYVTPIWTGSAAQVSINCIFPTEIESIRKISKYLFYKKSQSLFVLGSQQHPVLVRVGHRPHHLDVEAGEHGRQSLKVKLDAKVSTRLLQDWIKVVQLGVVDGGEQVMQGVVLEGSGHQHDVGGLQ